MTKLSKEELILEELKFNLKQIHHNEDAITKFMNFFIISPFFALFFIINVKNNPLIMVLGGAIGFFTIWLFLNIAKQMMSFKNYTLNESRKLEEDMEYFKPITKYTDYKNNLKSGKLLNLTISNTISEVLPNLNFLIWGGILIYGVILYIM